LGSAVACLRQYVVAGLRQYGTKIMLLLQLCKSFACKRLLQHTAAIVDVAADDVVMLLLLQYHKRDLGENSCEAHFCCWFCYLLMLLMLLCTPSCKTFPRSCTAYNRSSTQAKYNQQCRLLCLSLALWLTQHTSRHVYNTPASV
jgi:hypothetical protein